MDFFEIFGNLYCIVTLAGVVITLLIIIAYIKTYYHLKETSENTKKLQASLKVAINNQNIILARLDDIRGRQGAQYNQFYMDHCAANNLGPHEWVFLGADNTKSQFQCRKCGQIIDMPAPKPRG